MVLDQAHSVGLGPQEDEAPEFERVLKSGLVLENRTLLKSGMSSTICLRVGVDVVVVKVMSPNALRAD